MGLPLVVSLSDHERLTSSFDMLRTSGSYGNIGTIPVCAAEILH